MSAARAALRRLQREQRKAERRLRLDGPTVVAALPIAEALRDPAHRQPVGEALLVAALCATTGERAEYGSDVLHLRARLDHGTAPARWR